MVGRLDQLRQQLTLRRCLAIGVAVLLGCGAGAAQDRAPVDAELDMKADSATRAELAAFRGRLETPLGLAAASHSRDALVRRFLDALATNDTTEIAAMHITAAEFAWFYYPDSPWSRRPYRQDPALFWLRLTAGSEKGIARALRTYGGRPLDVRGYACERQPGTWGAARVWQRCRFRTDEGPLRLFGSVIEWEGRYKFVSYTNDL